MSHPSLLVRLAGPTLTLAVVVSAVSGWRWYHSSSARRHFDRAAEFVRLRKGPEAEAEWKDILKDEPRNSAAAELLGEYYVSRHRWSAAVWMFRQLARVAPDKPHVQCRIAACLLRMDDQKDAFETAEAEIKRNPNCVAALGLVATLMTQRPNTEGKRRLDYLRRLAKLIPDDISVQRMYAEDLANGYLYDELRPVLSRIQMLHPNDIQAYNLQGLADLARTDQPQGALDAVKDYETSLRLDTVNPGAHFGIGRAYLRLGNAKQAVAHLEIAARCLPNVARMYRELTEAYRGAGQAELAKWAQARFLYLERLGREERVLSVRCIAYPKDPRYPRRLGELYTRIGDPSRALFYLKQADQLKPGDPRVAALIARSRAEVHRVASAAPVNGD